MLSVETPDTRGWDARIFRRGYWGGYHIPRHFYLFDASTLSRLLVEQGFEVVSVRSILSPAFWVYSVHNALADSPRLRRLARWFHAQSPLPMAVAAEDLARAMVVRFPGRPGMVTVRCPLISVLVQTCPVNSRTRVP